MSELSRRKFLKTTAAGIAVPSVFLAGAKKGLAAPSERVRMAVIGVGGQGSGHAKGWHKMKETELVAVCDVDPKHRNKVAKETNSKPVADYRRIMDDKSIDAVSIATPDHWHTPVALAALVAGKHVYVEKPCCHSIYEGKLLVKAAKEFGKCVQHGTQYRGNDDAIEGIKRMKEGLIGEMLLAKAINHQRRGKVGRQPVTDPPEGVDYDLWLGPAPKHPFTKNRWHYKWHWFWDYGTGDMGNDGIHQVDVARWGVGQKYPKAALVSGGQLWYDDDHQTPDTQTIVFEYDGCHLMFEMRLWTPYNLGACHECGKHKGHDNGVIFYGTKGKMEIGRKGCHIIIDGKGEKIKGEGGRGGIRGNFIECIKANDPSKLLAPIDEGFASAVLCHIGNIGVRLGGARLEYDGKNHRFIDNDEANKYVKGHYRKGYELAYTG